MLRWTPLDSFLAFAAVLGVVALLLVLPRQHPDGAADYSLSEAGAEAAVIRAAESFGYDVTGWNVVAEPQRHTRLVDSLQARFGRRATVDLLSDPETAERLPVYHWRGELEEPDGSGDIYVRLTQRGDVWDFHPDPDAIAETRYVDTQALGFALDVLEGDTTFAAMPDSLLLSTFNFTEKTASDYTTAPYTWAGLAGVFHLDLGNAALGNAAVSNATVRVNFGRATAERLARYHAGRVEALRHADPLVVDSMAFEDRVMRVMMSGLVESVPVEVDIGVEATGQLHRMDVTFVPAEDSTDSAMIIFGIIMGAAYVLLGLTLVVYFFRRFFARLMDVRQALVDGLIVAVPLTLMLVLLPGFMNTDTGNTLASLSLSLVMFFIVLAFLGMMLMMIAGSVEGLAQDAWASKLRASALVRKASLLNERVGYAFVRGTLAGIALAGLSALLLLALPIPLRLKEDVNILFASFPARGVLTFLSAGPMTYMVLAPALLGVGSFLRLRNLPTWAIVLGVTLVVSLLGPFTYTLNPPFFTWLVVVPSALVLTLVFIRFDFLTAFLAGFFTMVMWSAGHSFVIGGLDPTIDAAISALVTVGALGLGFVGIRSGSTGDERVDYVPAYVTELAHQERLKQELEIAHQVQASFLPKRMPDMAGVDMAAMCLAAHEVGGDYYDFIPLSDTKLAVVIGDVSGKGIQAAFFMTLTKGFLRSLVRQEESPAEVLRRLNALFCESAPRGTFISMIYGVLDTEARTFTFARAGHNPLILKRSPSQAAKPVSSRDRVGRTGETRSEFVQPGGMAIGFTTGPRFDTRIEEEVLSLRTSDVVVLYTDGFSEAMDLRKDLYGDDRLAERIADFGAHPAAEILQGVATDVQRFAGAAPQHDDMTMLVFKLTAPDSAFEPTGLD